MAARTLIPFPEVPDVDVEHRFVDARGVRFHVAFAGPADAEPLLLLHGWPQHWFMWRRVLPELARTRRCILPDLRGLGWSEAPATSYAKTEFAADVLALLDALAVERVDLLAHDWGGWTGFLLALRAPERLRRFLALNIAPPWPPWPGAHPTLRGLLSLRSLWYQAPLAVPGLGPRLMRTPAAIRAMLRRDAVHPDAFTPQALAAYTAPLTDPARARASSRLYRTFLTREALPVMAGREAARPLTVPTHLLFGVRDAYVRREFVAAAAARRPSDPLTITYVPDAGHFLAEDRPDIVLSHAARFLRTEAPTPPLERLETP